MAEKEGPRRGLSLFEVLGILTILAFLASFVCPWGLKALCSAREGTATHLIQQLDTAVESYHLDYAVYPPGDGTGSRTLVEALRKRGPKKQAYFEFPPDLLEPPPVGDVINPVCPDAPFPRNVIHYLSPGRRRPEKFDLWAEDCRGNPTGVNNWDTLH